MSSLVQGSAQTPNPSLPQQMGEVKSMNRAPVTFYGSFQGFVTSTSNYLATQSRGTGFTVQWVSTGRYRVVLTYNFPVLGITQTAAAAGGMPGNPPGLLQEPHAMAISETAGTAPTIASVRAAKLDRTAGSTYNTFDIFTFNSGGSASDLGSGDRVQFDLVFAQVNTNP